MLFFYTTETRDLQIEVLTRLLEKFEARMEEKFDHVLSAKIDYVAVELEHLTHA